MAVNGVSFSGFNRYVAPRMGVDPDGNPVYYNPDKAKTPKNADLEALKEKQKQAIQEILDSGRSINPMTDKVFIDTLKGELTTIKPGVYFEPSMNGRNDFKPPKNPGLYDPEAQQRNAERRVNVATGLLGLSAIVAAIVFRKPIGNALGKVFGGVVDFVKPAAQKCLEYAGKAVNYVKDMAQPLLAKIIKAFGKGTAAV